MKNFILLSITTITLITTLAFIPFDKASKSENNPGLEKLKQLTYIWDILDSEYTPVWEKDATWLRVGLRSKYALAKKYASLEMMETAFDCPVFVKGPHKREMDFYSSSSFGYYNPEFILKLRASIRKALSDPLFTKVLKQVYNTYFKSMAHTYIAAYHHVNDDQIYLRELQNQYLIQISYPDGSGKGSFQERFRSFAESLEKSEQADIYEGFTAPAFWLRRSIDGTGQQLYDLLDLIVEVMED